MNAEFIADFFDARSSRRHPVRVSGRDGLLMVRGDGVSFDLPGRQADVRGWPRSAGVSWLVVAAPQTPPTGSTLARDVALYTVARLAMVAAMALILVLAFVALAAIPMTDTKVMAHGLGAGILLDATVVRMLLVPALVSLFGQWNWWLPALPARLLRVQPSPMRHTPPMTLEGVPLATAAR